MSERRGDTFVIEPPAEAISFSTFLLGLASSTLIHLGVTPNPETGAVQVSIELAQQSMDLLDLLRAKTRGNLTPEEEQLFQSMLTDLKLRFVEARKSRS
ncbi:MAG: DUF1844 domain-containing protein [Myxococcaceae bacterium]|nr:DUF1844 domain-containing protein [Myxococcaceae bacterium]